MGVPGLRAMNGTIWAAKAVGTNVHAGCVAGLCHLQEGGQSLAPPARVAGSAD